MGARVSRRGTLPASLHHLFASEAGEGPGTSTIYSDRTWYRIPLQGVGGLKGIRWLVGKKGPIMNKKERVDAALRGDPVDRVPVSMWGHDFEHEWNTQAFVEAMIENYTRYDWDFMKVNPRASYHVEGWKVK